MSYLARFLKTGGFQSATTAKTDESPPPEETKKAAVLMGTH